MVWRPLFLQKLPTLQTEVFGLANSEAISKDLDMEDELREAIPIRIASYQQRMENLYNKHIRPRAFQAGDLVLRKIFENKTDPTVEKFQPNWEGPNIVVRVGVARSYRLNKVDGTPVPRMWNAMHQASKCK